MIGKRFLPAMLLSICMLSAQAFAQSGTEVSSVSPAAAGDNILKIQDAKGAVGSTVTVKALVTVDTTVYGAQFDLLFDQTKLQILALSQEGVKVGSGAGGLTAPVI